MKKINKKQIFIFIAIMLFIIGEILPRELNNLDEIWNFNFARVIANGMFPYRDFNIIQGPLLPLISALFLKIFGQEMIVTRVLAIVLDSIVLFLTYKIMNKLNVKDYIKYLTLIILAIIMKPYFTLDYNWLSLSLVLVIIYLELTKNKSIKQQIIIGILAGFTITIKQTTGLVISVATIVWSILKTRNFEDLKKYLKSILFRFFGVISIVILFLLILVSLGILTDYIDYCILGIKTFSNSISYIERLINNSNILIKLLSISPIIVYLALLIMYLKTKKDEALVLFTYGITQMVVVYPIADESHFCLAIVPTVISIGYLINNLIEKMYESKKIEIIINNFLMSFITLCSIFFLINGIYIYKAQNINMELNHFKLIPIEQQGIEQNKKMGEFIKTNQKDVYILDAVAALYMVPIDRYNKDFDMFNIGNLGSKGEDGQIEKIKKMDNSIFLIRNNNYSRNWQNPEKVRKFIIKNLTKTGEIGIFDIYERKEENEQKTLIN